LHGHYALWDSNFGWLGLQASSFGRVRFNIFSVLVGLHTQVVKEHLIPHTSTMVADKRKPRDKWPLAQPHAKTSQICFLPNGFEDPNSRTPATSSSTHGPRGRGCHIYPTRNRIFGEPPSVDEFLEPAEEQQVGEFFESGDEAIIAVVRQEMAEKAGQVIGVDSEEEDESRPPARGLSHGNACAVTVSAARRKLPPVRKY
jgi:hypothetical protein